MWYLKLPEERSPEPEGEAGRRGEPEKEKEKEKQKEYVGPAILQLSVRSISSEELRLGLERPPRPCWKAGSEAYGPACPNSNRRESPMLIGCWTRTHGLSYSREVGYPICHCIG